MLRRRPDNIYEFREIERMLYSIQPPALAPDRKDALRSRIMASLGEQDELRRAALPLLPEFRERWIAIPAGVGLAAAIIAGMTHYPRGADPTNGLTARVAGPVMVDGNVSAEARGGDLLEALSAATIDIGSHFRVSLEPGSRFSYYESDGKLTFRPYSGTATFVTGGRDAFLVGDGWFGRMATGTVAELSVSSDALVVHVADGVLWVQVGREPEIRLTKDLPAIRLSLAGTPSISEEDLLPPAWNGSGPGSAPLSAPPASPVLGAGASAAPPQTLPAALSAPPATVPQPGQVPASNA
ncbi:MAG TPA: hypothetical protein PKD27_12700, partial [Tepidiformaceae bacterium]|nr:hypothetical protein [Tepidiformaceae bacterium]